MLGGIQQPRWYEGVGRWSKSCHFCPLLVHKKCPLGVYGWSKKGKIMSTWLLNAPLVYLLGVFRTSQMLCTGFFVIAFHYEFSYSFVIGSISGLNKETFELFSFESILSMDLQFWIRIMNSAHRHEIANFCPVKAFIQKFKPQYFLRRRCGSVVVVL